jgi:multisubunit Na+/H+ antiporter MnhF subunit
MPKPLLTKLIVLTAVGFFFVLVGCVYGIHSKDDIFIMLSLLIGLCSLIRTISFYRLIHNESYRVLSGTCIRQTSIPLKKDRQIVLVDETQREYRLTLNKNSKLLPGHRYRLYFRQSGKLNSESDSYSSMDLLGYEELHIDN